MLSTLGRGLQGRSSSTIITTIPGSGGEASSIMFDFLSGTLPAELTYTRSDNVATTRNASGKWVAVPANTPRFDHDNSGTPLGLRFEPPRENKVNHVNFAPLSIGGIVATSGDGVASVVADASINTALIDGSPFTDLQNGDVIALTGGTTNTTYRISLSTGNTNNYSFRVLVAPQGTGYQGNVKLNNGEGLKLYGTESGVWEEIISQNFGSNHTSRYLAIYVTAGNTVHLGAAQFEEGSFISSPIITSGETGVSRAREVCRSANLIAADWFDKSQGAMIVDCIFGKDIGYDHQYVVHAGTNGSLSDALALYSLSGSGQIRARDIISGTNNHNDDVHRPITGKRFPMALTWRDNESYAVAGSMRYEHRSYTGVHNDMDDLYIGGRPYSTAMNGWVKSLLVYDSFRSLNQLGAEMFPSSAGVYKAIASGGQSNKHGYYRSQVGQLNGGEVAAVAEMDQVWTSSENWMLNGAENGSYAIKQNDANADTATENWWGFRKPHGAMGKYSHGLWCCAN